MKDFESLNKKELLKILAVVILSDGTMRQKQNYIRLLTSDKSECLHDLFRYLCIQLFEQRPNNCKTIIKTGFKKNERCSQTTLYSKQAINSLLRLNKNYKTTRGNLEVNEYLKTVQPKIKFLINSNTKLKWLAFRTWFDFDGCLIPSFGLKRKKEKRKETTYYYYQVQFAAELRIAETNPHLVEQLIKLCSKMGLNAIIKYKKKNWSGLDGICITKRDDIKKFISQGGPITEVKVSDKSPRFSGITKRKICEAVYKIITDDTIKKSAYFKDKNEAAEYKKKMDNLLLDLVRS